MDESTLASSGGELPDEGTLYSDPSWKSIFGKDYLKKFSDFLYVCQGEDTKTGGTLIFARNLSVADADIPFRTNTEFKEWYWDPILKAIVFLRDQLPRSNTLINAVGIGSANQDTYSPREVYIPGGKIGSLFTIEEYFGPRKFDIPFYETPVTRSVTYAVPGANGGFPNCIGEKIVIPNLQAGVVTFVAGSVNGIGGQIDGQIFPETNITEWQLQVVSHTQQTPKDGIPGYYAIKISVSPPEEPDTIIQD